MSFVPITLFFLINGNVYGPKFDSNVSLETPRKVISTLADNGESNKLTIDKDVINKYLSENKLILLFDRSDRLSMWTLALRNFKDNPVLGLGYGNFIHTGFYLYYLEGSPIYGYPHNILLEIASQTGLIGLTIFTILVTYSFILQFRTYKISSLSMYFTSFICFFFFVSQFGGDLYDFRYFWILALIGVLNSHLHEPNIKQL
jgi:O-antigen ligase